jgi:hypothetical protein
VICTRMWPNLAGCLTLHEQRTFVKKIRDDRDCPVSLVVLWVPDFVAATQSVVFSSGMNFWSRRITEPEHLKCTSASYYQN